uniref:Glycosyltransferase family 92 protein n=1 Tax=Ixodes ricinus TaxID=34613 RepID=A0A6B0VBD2_IXORI
MRRSRPMRKFLAFTLVISSLLFVYILVLPFRSNVHVYTCLNQNHHDVESRLASFNGEVKRSLIAGDAGEQIQYEDGDHWHSVFPGIHVYSAYLEKGATSDSWIVRIISVTENDDPKLQTSQPNIQCWISAGRATYVAQATYEPVREHDWLPLGTASFFCPVEFPEAVLKERMVRVALGISHRMDVPVWLDVHMPQKSKAKCCAVCTTPIAGHFDKLSVLAEFVGYYSTVGVRRFDFYVGDVSRDVELLLVHLQRVSGADIVMHKWNLQFNRSELLEHRASQLDCSYRSRFESEYVINADFEEFLVPKHGRSIPEALRTLEASYGEDSIGSIVVQKHFFCSEYAYDKDNLDRRYEVPLMTRVRQLREVTSWRFDVPWKYITKANATEYAGAGFALGRLGERRVVDAGENALALHHYTSCCGLSKPVLYGLVSVDVLSNSELVEDGGLRRFGDAIANSTAIALVNSFVAAAVESYTGAYEPLMPLDGEFHFWYL